MVLNARAGELERDFPFGVVRQLFEAVVADPDALAGAAATARVVFASPDEGAPTGDASFAALHGLYWLALNLAAERPLLLEVDDLQWCDRPSLRFLAYLVRRLEGQPVLVTASVRTGDPPTDAALLAEIANDPATAHVRPGPLSEDAVGQLVAKRLGAEPDRLFREACHRTTGGNPLLVRQLLNALETESVKPDAAHADVVRAIGSRAVSSSVLLRLARLPGEAAAVASAVAILGEGADLRAGGRRGRARRGAGRGRDGGARTGRDPAPRAAAGVRAPARPRRRLPRAAARRARAAARARRPRTARHRRVAGPGRRPAHAHAAARRCRRGAAAPRCRPGSVRPRRGRQFRQLSQARARRATAGRAPAAVAAGPRRGRGAHARPGRCPPPARGLRGPDRRRPARPRRERARPHPAVHRLAGRRRRRGSPGGARAAAGDGGRGARARGVRAHGRAVRRARPGRDAPRRPVPHQATGHGRREDDGRGRPRSNGRRPAATSTT